MADRQPFGSQFIGNASQGGLAGTIGLKIELHQGDIMRLRARLKGIPPRITEGLWDRARNMAAAGVKKLDETAPHGAGTDWARGDPPLEGSHRSIVATPFYAELYSIAPHAPHIVLGFTPHMPPEEAWIGDPELSYIMRRAVLRNGTPNTKDYFTPVAEGLQVANIREANRLANLVFGMA